MVDNTHIVQVHDDGLEATFRHWIHGFMLQTIIYGINAILFLMSIWVLSIHIIKGSTTHRFHKHHLLQNSALLLHSVVMFALSSVVMAHQGVIAGDTWSKFLDLEAGQTSMTQIAEELFGNRANLHKACNATLVLVEWGATGFLLWRCVVHWKVRSIFPSQIMLVPFLVFIASIATGLLRIIHEVGPGGLSASAQQKNWTLISWSIATGQYYLMAMLIATRVLYHRFVIQREIGAEDTNKLTSYLSIAYDSGVVVLPSATAYLIALAKFPHLIYLFQSTVTQNQVMLCLLIVQRLSAGRTWSGKTIDCILNSRLKAEPVSENTEEVTTMGFNPNTGLSSTQNDIDLERSNKKMHHDLPTDFHKVNRV